MNIETITIQHPNLQNREITLLLVDDNIDIPSTEFLIYESRYGGRHGGILGKSSHSGLAFQVAELYRHLDDMNLKWNEAIENDIKIIRNAMLCWDSNNNKAYENYPYEPIKNDSMNHKLNTWFKFYKYMDKISISNDMVLTTKRIRRFKPKGMLDHINKRFDSNENDYIDTWTLKVKPSPKSLSYHALSRTEFAKLRQHLKNIDVVYEMLAVFMVETGLRIDAALNAPESDFKGLLKLYANGKGLNDIAKRSYTAKGGDIKQYDLPLRTIQEINDNYLMRVYHERMYMYEQRCEKLGHEINDEILWISSRGKEIKKHDVWTAFSDVSKLMGRTVNTITPHWLRHTFATWTIMDVANAKGIPLENTGITPNPLLISALQQKLGHADAMTTMRYIATALKLMGLDLNDGGIKISLRSFLQHDKSQELVKREAEIEFGEDFNEDYFDVVKYAISREIVVDDELILNKNYN
jgi:integrase